MQTELFDKPQVVGRKTRFADPNFATNKSLPVHRWVPWIAGFSSDFVRDVIEHEVRGKGTVLDPFAGVGTTLVEAAFMGHDVLGFEINPYAALACSVKLEARRIETAQASEHIRRMLSFCQEAELAGRTPESQPPPGFRTRSDFYSERVLTKVLTLQDFISSIDDDLIRRLFQLAFAATMVSYSNYSYEPSLGTRRAAGREDIADASVAHVVAAKLVEMVEDVQWVAGHTHADESGARVVDASFFDCADYVPPCQADVAITSPPYMNNYHYIRNTRPHLYWLGFAEKPKDLESLEESNFGKYWQTVREAERIDLCSDDPPADLVRQIEALRTLNLEKGVYGGNGWANYVAAYFNDCHRFAGGLRHVLKPGAAAYVVIGDSIIQGLMMPTDVYLGEIAQRAGMELSGIYIPRSERVGSSIIKSDVRVGKAAPADRLYEAVVVLRKPR